MRTTPATLHAPVLAALFILSGLGSPPASAQSQAGDFDTRCARWIEKKGYSADYIEQRTGKRQAGFPKFWRANVEPKDVQAGDVVISYIKQKGQSMRVAYVEEVKRNADGTPATLIVSEWNMGRYVDEPCFVTDHFGRLSESKPFTMENLDKVWRPTLPMRGGAAKE